MERQVRTDVNQERENQERNTCHITPSIMDINLSHESISHSIKNLRSNSACGPDKVSTKLLKMVGEAIVSEMCLRQQEGSRCSFCRPEEGF